MPAVCRDEIAAGHIVAVERSLGCFALLADELVQGHHRRRAFKY